MPSTYLESSVGTGRGLGGIQERSVGNKRCTAKERFNGNMKDTISFGVGEVFEIIEKSDTGWWYVQNSTGQEGWAPQDLLEEGVKTKPQRQAPQSPKKTLPQSSTFDHLSSVSNKPTIPASRSFNNDLKAQLKPVTPNKPIQQDKPVFQNKQVIKPDKPGLPVRPETNSKSIAPEKPVLPNTGIQNNNRPIKIGSIGPDKPTTPGKPSYSKVKIGVSGVESDKPSLPSRPRHNLTETQTPPSNNKPQVTPKPKPENGNVQNELASMLSKRMQTSSKPLLSATPNKPSRPISQEIGTAKPMLAAPNKLPEPSKSVLPSRPRPGRPTAPTDNNNNTNNNSTSSKYITIDDNRAYDDGCLSFRKGETAELIEKGENGWWRMRIRKDDGWVFKDKVKLERGAPPIPQGASIGPIALEDFRAEYAESVSLKKGDSIQIIEGDSGSGWTWVRVGKQEGWVPTDIISSCK